jgi:hypothetical protein
MSFTYTPRSAEAWAARAGKKFNGEVSPTAMQKFLQPTTDPVITTPPVSPEFVEKRREYLRCVTCGHWRLQHCTKHKLRPGQVPTDQNWKGFIDDAGSIQPCQHTPEAVVPYACDSVACAVRLGTGEDEHYCPCKKFVNPNAKKRVPKPRTPKALPSSAEFGTLIPKADLITANRRFVREEALKLKESQLLAAATETDLTALSAKEIAKITGMTQIQVRQTLRKIGITLPRAAREKMAFVTGQVNP